MSQIESLEKPHPNLAEASYVLKALARSVAAARAYSGAESALADGQLNDRQREQIALAVAEINGCQQSVAAHSMAALRAGLSHADIRLARNAASTDPVSSAMLAFTLMVVLQRGEIKPENLKTIRDAGFSEVEIIEIVANIAINIFTNYLNLIFKNEANYSRPESNGKMAGSPGRLAGKDL
jgi:uncharacterized peroxidase-related enzyme